MKARVTIEVLDRDGEYDQELVMVVENLSIRQTRDVFRSYKDGKMVFVPGATAEIVITGTTEPLED